MSFKAPYPMSIDRGWPCCEGAEEEVGCEQSVASAHVGSSPPLSKTVVRLARPPSWTSRRAWLSRWKCGEPGRAGGISTLLELERLVASSSASRSSRPGGKSALLEHAAILASRCRLHPCRPPYRAQVASTSPYLANLALLRLSTASHRALLRPSRHGRPRPHRPGPGPRRLSRGGLGRVSISVHSDGG
jgi:hypothetical protein